MNGIATESPLVPETGWSTEWSSELETGTPAGSGGETYESYERWNGAGETSYALRSPFLSGTNFGDGPSRELPTPAAQAAAASLASPFLSGFVPTSQQEQRSAIFEQLLAELEDESFEHALDHLINTAAGQYLASEATWSAAREAPAQATTELERWLQPLGAEMERLLEDVSNRLAAEEFEALREPELEHLLESLRPEPGVLPEAFENFLGGFFNKIKNVAKGAWNLAKKGVEAIGKILPIGQILNKLKDLVRPLLKRVLQTAIGHLPTQLQPMAKDLAAKLLGSAEAEGPTFEDAGPAREFDIGVASLLLAPSEAEAENVVWELGAGVSPSAATSPLGELDTARARLAQQLQDLPLGHSPVAELEQFIPAVMAVMPIIRMGMGLIGRDRIVGFLADRLAGLIGGLVGADAAKALSRPIVDAGLRMLHLEAPLGSEASLGAEALVSTVEDTVRHVLELPAEAFEDTLRLEAEVQQAFTEAAARHVPAELLRPDLPERETAGEGGVWILMPRATRPRFRYKKYTRVFVVPISRQVARHIVCTDGGTLESALLDRGATGWPVQAEVHLYETLPGAQLGHIAQFEGEEPSRSLSETLGELQPLTPEAASLLLREPALGRRLPAGADPASLPGLPSPKHGQRYYRLRLPGQVRHGSAKPHHRFHIEMDLASATPRLKVHMRLSEREAQHIAGQLTPAGLPGVVAWLKERYQRTAPLAFARRLLKHGPLLVGSQVTQAAADKLGAEMAEGLTKAITGLVSTRQAELAAAVRDPAQGITITFSFTLPGRTAPAGAISIPGPTVSVRSGWHHHHAGAAPLPGSPRRA